jgi:hypothetical protein
MEEHPITVKTTGILPVPTKAANPTDTCKIELTRNAY